MEVSISQSLNLKAAGLFSHPNRFSKVPEGALDTADNVSIDREGIIEPRRGFDRLTYGFGTSTDRAHQFGAYQDKLLVHYATTKLAYYLSGSGWQDYTGSFTKPTSAKMRFAQANQNQYFSTASGVKKLDVFSGTPTSAGTPKGLAIEGTTTGASGFLADTYKVVYRMLWYIADANGNYIYGAPSQRAVVTNSVGGAATRDISLTFTVPSGITTSHYYQIYRSSQVESTDEDPNDELGLVYEDVYTSGSTVTITDNTPDDLRGATIYTAASQEGIVAANDQPPLANDIAVFANAMWYARTTTKHRYYITLLASSGSSGITTNDTITTGGIAYTAKAATDVAAAQFKFFTAGSASQNIADTAKELVKVINQHTSSTVYAYYLSGPDDLPGKILIEERSVGGAAFTTSVSRTTAWTPKATASASTNDSWQNGLFFSKSLQPESVPITNYFRVGSANNAILRIIPLRDSMFIFKEQEGIYRLVGDSASNFRIDLFDNTVRLKASESISVLNNQIFCLTDQGVVAVTETGVSVVSRPIEDTILELFGADSDAVADYSFGIGYESDRKYILYTISQAGDTNATQAFVFNTFTTTWTRWDLEATAGIVDPATDKLIIDDPDSQYTRQEFKNFNFRDHVDYGFTSTISAWDSTTKVITMAQADQVNAGDVIWQSDSIYSIVTATDAVAGTVTVSFSAGFTAAACTVYRAISTVVRWVPITGGNPGMLKQFRELSLIFTGEFTLNGDLVFRSDISASPDTVEITGAAVGLWGLFTWGNVAWGGGQRSRPIRTYVPRDKQRGTQLILQFEHSIGYSKYQLAGASIIFTFMSEKVMR